MNEETTKHMKEVYQVQERRHMIDQLHTLRQSELSEDMRLKDLEEMNCSRLEEMYALIFLKPLTDPSGCSKIPFPNYKESARIDEIMKELSFFTEKYPLVSGFLSQSVLEDLITVCCSLVHSGILTRTLMKSILKILIFAMKSACNTGCKAEEMVASTTHHQTSYFTQQKASLLSAIQILKYHIKTVEDSSIYDDFRLDLDAISAFIKNS